MGNYKIDKTNDSVVVYENEEWSGVYLNGSLVDVGDSYNVLERLLDAFGVETVQSEDWFLGIKNPQRDEVATSLDEIEKFRISREVKEDQASSLRAQAQALLDEADKLENK